MRLGLMRSWNSKPYDELPCRDGRRHDENEEGDKRYYEQDVCIAGKGTVALKATEAERAMARVYRAGCSKNGSRDHSHRNAHCGE